MARTTWREERQSVCCPCARISQSNHRREPNFAAILLSSKPTLPPFAPLEFRISRKGAEPNHPPCEQRTSRLPVLPHYKSFGRSYFPSRLQGQSMSLSDKEGATIDIASLLSRTGFE